MPPPRRRIVPGATAVAVVAALAIAGSAGAVSRVSQAIVGGGLSVRVDAVQGTDGDHGLLIEPFIDTFRDGYRVTGLLPSQEAVEADTSNCLRNPLLNDVVCSGVRGPITVTGGDGPDGLVLAEDAVEPLRVCAERPTPVVRATVTLGPGADTVGVVPLRTDECASGTEPESGMRVVLDARGEAGDDRMSGGSLGDLISGGEDRDTLTGNGGDDDLDAGPGDDTVEAGTGNDVLRGQAGDDVLSGGDGTDGIGGGAGNDVLRGGAGGDRFEGGPGDDVFDGGPGIDTVNYIDALPLGQPVAATIGDDTSGDGPVGERDRIGPSVENVTGGRGPDSIIGSDQANELRGGPGGDTLRGQAGADVLRGEDGADVLAGGTGPDVLNGGADADRLLGQEDRDVYDAGPGDDSIDARDGVRETVDCGPGTDVADVDLFDTVPVVFSLSRCETVFRAPVDDGPPGRPAGRILRVDRAGAARVVIVCPAAARVACRGTLTLRRIRGGRVLARVPYLARLGGRAAVRVTLAGASGTQVVAATVERGVSRRGPRGTRAVLRVVRG